MGMYRDATGEFHSPKHVDTLFSDDDIIYNNSLILPHNMIRLARMSLLCRAVKKRCSAVLDLINVMPMREGSWCFSVFQDLQWASSDDKFSSCRDFSLVQWIGYMEANPLCNKAIKKHCASPWANVYIGREKARKDPEAEYAFACTKCLYKCDTWHHLATHASSSHGKKDPIRMYLPTNVCPICLTGFSNREGVLEHARRGRTPCKRQLILMGPVLTEQQADAIDFSLRAYYRDRHRKGQRRHKAETPCVRAFGPPTPRVVGPVAQLES